MAVLPNDHLSTKRNKRKAEHPTKALKQENNDHIALGSAWLDQEKVLNEILIRIINFQGSKERENERSSSTQRSILTRSKASIQKITNTEVGPKRGRKAKGRGRQKIEETENQENDKKVYEGNVNPNVNDIVNSSVYESVNHPGVNTSSSLSGVLKSAIPMYDRQAVAETLIGLKNKSYHSLSYLPSSSEDSDMDATELSLSQVVPSSLDNNNSNMSSKRRKISKNPTESFSYEQPTPIDSGNYELETEMSYDPTEEDHEHENEFDCEDESTHDIQNESNNSTSPPIKRSVLNERKTNLSLRNKDQNSRNTSVQEETRESGPNYSPGRAKLRKAGRPKAGGIEKRKIGKSAKTAPSSSGKNPAATKSGGPCFFCETKVSTYWRNKNDHKVCNPCGIRLQKYQAWCPSCRYVPTKEEYRGTCKCGTKFKIFK